MTRSAVLLVAGAVLSIVLLPGRAAAQGLPRPALRADFGATKPQIVRVERRATTHHPGTTLGPLLTHRMAPAPVQRQTVLPAVDCGMRIFQTGPTTDPKIVHRPVHPGAVIRVAPMAPCPVKR